MEITNKLVTIHVLKLSTQELKWIANDTFNHMYSLSAATCPEFYQAFAEQLKEYADGFHNDDSTNP